MKSREKGTLKSAANWLALGRRWRAAGRQRTQVPASPGTGEPTRRHDQAGTEMATTLARRCSWLPAPVTSGEAADMLASLRCR